MRKPKRGTLSKTTAMYPSYQNTAVVSGRVPVSFRDALDDIAAHKGVTRSAVVEEAIRQYLKRQGIFVDMPR